MARPERNNVDYFPFLCKEGKTMFYIEEKYRNDGFATWIKILRQLAVTDYHFLNLSNKVDIMFLSSKCKVSEIVLENIINDLCEMGEFEYNLWHENKIVFSVKFVDHIKDAYLKRNNECITLSSLLTLLDSLGIRKLDKLKTKVPVKPQSKEDYIKEEESKEEETKLNETEGKKKGKEDNFLFKSFSEEFYKNPEQAFEKIKKQLRSNNDSTTTTLPEVKVEVETKLNIETEKKQKENFLSKSFSDDFYKTREEAFEEIKNDDLQMEKLLLIVHRSGFRTCNNRTLTLAIRSFVTIEAAKPGFNNRPRVEIKQHMVNWINKNANDLQKYAV